MCACVFFGVFERMRVCEWKRKRKGVIPDVAAISMDTFACAYVSAFWNVCTCMYVCVCVRVCVQKGVMGDVGITAMMIAIGIFVCQSV